MPRLTSTGLPPLPMASMPSWMIACASTVAVVVPSPTTSLVLIAASLTSCAPMFSNWSRRWISRAIVTPSLVTTGEPVIFSRMTLRPLGPSVDFTASASWSTPASSRLRASSAKRSSLAIDPPTSVVGPAVVVRGAPAVVGPSGHEDRPPAHLAGVEIGDRLDGVVEGVGAGVERHLAALGEHHQLGQLVVGADDVSDDVALGGDDRQRRPLERAAVADHVVAAAGPGHLEALVLRTLLGHEVEHDVGAPAVGQLLHLGDVRAVGHHGVVGAELLGQLERGRVAVDHDDVRRGEGGQALDPDVAQPAGAYERAGGAGVEQRDRLADRVVGGDAGVRQRRDVLGLRRRVELHAGPG